MQGDCERIQEGLLFFLEQGGDGEDSQQVAEHLRHCLSCRERAENIRMLNGWLNSLPRRALPGGALLEGALTPFIARLPERRLPEGFDRKILGALREEKARESAEARRGGWRVLQSLAAAAAIAALSLISFRTLEREPSYPRAMQFSFSMGRSFYSHKPGPMSRTRASGPQEVSGQMDRRGKTSSDLRGEGKSK